MSENRAFARGDGVERTANRETGLSPVFSEVNAFREQTGRFSEPPRLNSVQDSLGRLELGNQGRALESNARPDRASDPKNLASVEKVLLDLKKEMLEMKAELQKLKEELDRNRSSERSDSPGRPGRPGRSTRRRRKKRSGRRSARGRRSGGRSVRRRSRARSTQAASESQAKGATDPGASGERSSASGGDILRAPVSEEMRAATRVSNIAARGRNGRLN